MICDWKEPIDSGEFIVLVVDCEQINNPEVEMQATYATLTGKTVLALIERPGEPAEYMKKLPVFMFEGFDPGSKRDFDRSMTKLIARRKEILNISDSPKIRFLCYTGSIDCEAIMRDGII